jgi:hypothetical protein
MLNKKSEYQLKLWGKLISGQEVNTPKSPLQSGSSFVISRGKDINYNAQV